MAISIFKQPEDYQPIHTPIGLEAGSNNTANEDFKYKVTIIFPSTTNRTLFISPRPDDSRLELDLATHLRDYLEYEDFILPTGFNFTRAPYVEYSVSIQENWEGEDQGDPTEIGGFIATNILLNRQQWLQEAATDFDRYHIKEDGIAPVISEVLMHKPLGAPMFKDEYYYVHAVGIPTNQFIQIQINQYDAAGNLIFPQTINAAGVSTQFAKAVFARLDMSSLTYNADAVRIGITFQDGLGNDVTTEKLFDIADYSCTSWERWKLVYMDRYGSYNNVSLDMISSSDYEVKPKTYRKRIDHLSDNSRKRGVTRYTQRSELKYMLNTDYLNEAQTEIIRDLIDSPVVYRDMRNIDGWDSGTFLPMEILTKKMKPYAYGANDMPQYAIEARYSYPENIRHE